MKDENGKVIRPLPPEGFYWMYVTDKFDKDSNETCSQYCDAQDTWNKHDGCVSCHPCDHPDAHGTAILLKETK